MSRGIVASRLISSRRAVGRLAVGDLSSLSRESPHGSAPAVLVEPRVDVQELQEGIRFLAEQPDGGNHLGVQARDRIHARYTWDHHTREIQRGLREVTACEP